MAGPAGRQPPGGGLGPNPFVRPGPGPGGWKPPLVNHDWARPGANIFNPDTMINSGNAIAGRIGGSDGNVFAGGWSGLSSEGLSSAADTLKGWYNREYARDLLSRWGWWSGGGWGSGDSGGYGGYGSSDSGYSNPYSTSDSGYSSPYSTQAEQGNESSANAASQEQNNSQSSSEPSKEDVASSRDEFPADAKLSMEKAVLAFQKGDYAEAQKQCEQAIRLLPGDANLQQFRALCQFAQGKYKDAAAGLYAVLAAGPGWDWKTLSSLYPSAQTYTTQLRALEQYVKEHPKDAAERFVLAYHYLVLDERDAGLNQLQEVVKLQPKDKVSAGLAKALEKAKKGEIKAPPDKPAPGR
jgi:Tetratricopeptide repeat